MRLGATPHEKSTAAFGRAAALCAIFMVAAVVFASPVSAQNSWQPVVATAKATPQPQPQPKSAAPSTTASIKQPAPAKLGAAAKPAMTVKPTIGPAFESFMADTRMAAQEPAAVPAPPTSQPAPGSSAAPQSVAAPAQTRKLAAEAPPLSTTAARQYCVNIADAAAEAKVAWQKKALLDVAQDVEKRVARLDEKIAEFQRWVARRDEFVKKARDTLVLIYSRMKPDAAALQLVAMEEETAAAVLLKLDPRVAGTILNEMEPGKAARLTATINGAAKEDSDAPPKGKTEAGKS